jgi:hypothetical protein
MTIRDLAAELMLNRPTEEQLVQHDVGKAKVQGGWFGHCSCGGWDLFSKGYDEGSERWVESQMHDHKAGVR